MSLLIITGHTGVGKTSVGVGVSIRPRISKIITYTTREPRETEIDGEDYFFVNEKEFFRIIEDGLFDNYVESFGGAYYGVLETDIFNAVNDHEMVNVVVLDIEGAIDISNRYKVACFVLNIVVPKKEIINRLKGRDDCGIIDSERERSLHNSPDLSFVDYSVMNESLSDCISDVSSICYSIQSSYDEGFYEDC